MNIRPIGAIFWRLDTSGNLTAFDATGNVIAKFTGSLFSAKLKSTGSNASGGTTASTTFVSTGIGADNFTPVEADIALHITSTVLSHTVANAQVEFAIYAKTAAGIPATGTSVGADTQQPGSVHAFTLGPATQTSTNDFAISLAVGVGTAITFYLAIRTITVGTITLGLRNYKMIEGI